MPLPKDFIVQEESGVYDTHLNEWAEEPIFCDIYTYPSLYVICMRLNAAYSKTQDHNRYQIKTRHRIRHGG